MNYYGNYIEFLKRKKPILEKSSLVCSNMRQCDRAAIKKALLSRQQNQE